ncbi:TIGR02530 family flagellar biosynthesis protein [Halalkalibacillus halophilus]|uniref:TIGR02530 family flagellar biosynthesis protein n=1 Tax=Halalkalibacillus halophilus TaxID=392827 RepID=UPI0004007877|nr:TIGR02530 family flagellar biosynthesis protein [Halalkalibacillus halophilus]
MNHKINPLHHQQPLPMHSVQKPKQAEPTKSFQSFLQDAATTELKVSKHAQKRLDERNIEIPADKWNMIEDRMMEAKQKGVTDSAIILDDAVLVASTKNNTIITAMNREEASNQLLTNINGTILMQE